MPNYDIISSENRGDSSFFNKKRKDDSGDSLDSPSAPLIEEE